MKRSSRKAGAFMTGAIFGSLVGAAVALLYAPQSGEETRTVIKDKSIEIKDRAVESGEELRQKAEEAASQARTRLDETTAATKERATAWQQRGQAFIEEQRTRFRSAIEAGRSSLSKPVEEDAGNGVKDTENGVEAPAAEA